MFRAYLRYKLYTESKLNNIANDKIDNGVLPTGLWLWDIIKKEYFFYPKSTNDGSKERQYDDLDNTPGPAFTTQLWKLL